jgi:hypothetical protein
MRDFLLPLALILVVVAGIWIYFTLSTPHAGPVRAVESSPADAVVPPPSKPQPQHKRLAVSHTEAATPLPAEPEPPKSTARRSASPQRVVVGSGSPEQVKVGMDAGSVVELLGTPDLTALSIDRGNLAETYIYKKKPGENLALIHLAGGRVVTAP